jgi:mersacidin/lichenicidin family type 2 lantibiotic
MSSKNIVRAWKDPVYRNSLSEAERAALPANPAGSIELSDADLGQVAGGLLTALCTKICSRFSCGCSTAFPHGLPC